MGGHGLEYLSKDNTYTSLSHQEAKVRGEKSEEDITIAKTPMRCSEVAGSHVPSALRLRGLLRAVTWFVISKRTRVPAPHSSSDIDHWQ